MLRHVVRTELNLEMAATEQMVRFALKIRPDTVTLVPERREELTTEGGLDAAALQEKLGPMIAQLQDVKIRVSLFIDPDPSQVEASLALKADAVELHTGRYCDADVVDEREREHARIVDAAAVGVLKGINVVAGHGLNYFNVRPVAALSNISELNIGHAIVARAAIVGMEVAVRDMLALMREART